MRQCVVGLQSRILADSAQEVARKIGKSDKNNSLQGINFRLIYMLGHGLAGRVVLVRGRPPSHAVSVRSLLSTEDVET